MTRLEDPALLRGEARFVDDIDVTGCLHAHFVRATEAHGDIVGIDIDEARDAPGVVHVATAATIGLDRFVHLDALPPTMTRHPLASDRVRHVGEAVAVIVADTAVAAEDAAELVWVDIEPREPVLGVDQALAADPLYPEAGTNLVLELEAEGSDPCAGAALVVEQRVVNQRLASAPIETDGIVATPRPDGGLDVWCTTQGVHGFRTELATALGMDPAILRVRAPAVGGAFGGRVSLPVEFAVVARLALDLGRPVRWRQSRGENLTGMAQGRDLHSTVRLGVDADGGFVGLDVDVLADVGATAHTGAALLVSVRRQAAGLYRVPRMRWRGRGLLTNTPPVGAYRGAGQPEANHARERVIDIVASRLGVDPIELRRRNLHAAADFPLTAAGGVTYDRADPARALDVAVERIDRERWSAEQRERRAAGDDAQLGIGVACYAQTSGRGNPTDSTIVTIGADGGVVVACGTPSHGQGHRTTWANLVSGRLGVPAAAVSVVDADTDAIDRGLTTGGSRATQVLATAIVHACDELIDQARSMAARELEAAEDDLVVVAATDDAPAGLAVAGVPARRVTWAALAAGTERSCLEAVRDDAALGEAHPYGAHASVVEVDVATGHVRLLAHVAVDDCGTVLEPDLVLGQQHGGSAAGLAQALWEFMAFDDNGTPQTADFTTYGLPTSMELCPIEGVTLDIATDRNILGTRGIGENGCNGATAAVHNAVIDAVSHLGVEHIDLPLTPERVWRAVNAASGGV